MPTNGPVVGLVRGALHVTALVVLLIIGVAWLAGSVIGDRLAERRDRAVSASPVRPAYRAANARYRLVMRRVALVFIVLSLVLLALHSL